MPFWKMNRDITVQGDLQCFLLKSLYNFIQHLILKKIICIFTVLLMTVIPESVAIIGGILYVHVKIKTGTTKQDMK